MAEARWRFSAHDDQQECRRHSRIARQPALTIELRPLCPLEDDLLGERGCVRVGRRGTRGRVAVGRGINRRGQGRAVARVIRRLLALCPAAVHRGGLCEGGGALGRKMVKRRRTLRASTDRIYAAFTLPTAPRPVSAPPPSPPPSRAGRGAGVRTARICTFCQSSTAAPSRSPQADTEWGVYGHIVKEGTLPATAPTAMAYLARRGLCMAI